MQLARRLMKNGMSDKTILWRQLIITGVDSLNTRLAEQGKLIYTSDNWMLNYLKRLKCIVVACKRR